MAIVSLWVAVSPTGFAMSKVAPRSILAGPSHSRSQYHVISAANDQTSHCRQLSRSQRFAAGGGQRGAVLPLDILARIIIGVCDNDDNNNGNANSNGRMIRDLHARRSSNWPDQTHVAN
jgi:hypothetical protein